MIMKLKKKTKEHLWIPIDFALHVIALSLMIMFILPLAGWGFQASWDMFIAGVMIMSAILLILEIIIEKAVKG